MDRFSGVGIPSEQPDKVTLTGPQSTVKVFATTDCIEHPKEHRMLRSPLDPGYGNSSQYYPDGVGS